MGTGALGLKFPSLLSVMELEAKEKQRQFFLATGAQFTLLALAAFASLLNPEALMGVGPWVAIVAILIVIGIQLSGVTNSTESRWYDARAASESIKSAAWQYSTGGQSFAHGTHDVDLKFQDVLREVLSTLRHLDVGVTDPRNAAVTQSMRDLRQSNIETRKRVYLEARVDDQVDWYRQKAAANKRHAGAFNLAFIVCEGAAVFFGLLRLRGDLNVDLLGPLMACAAGLIGWAQAKKYAVLAEAYAVTSAEVALVTANFNTGSEAAWARSVHDAEAAFSREHTMWLARRQIGR